MKAAMAEMQKTILQLQAEVADLQKQQVEKEAAKPAVAGAESVIAGIQKAVIPSGPARDSGKPFTEQAAEKVVMTAPPGTDGLVRVYDDPRSSPLDQEALKGPSRFAGLHELGDSGWWIRVGGLLKTDLGWYEDTRADAYSSYVSLTQSRLNVDMRRDTDLGPVRLFYEFNFSWNVRHLYAQIGRLTFGQTWSAFYDVDASPDLLMVTALPNFGYRLEPQIRYTFPLSAEGWSLTAAVESSAASQYIYGATFADQGYMMSRLPTFLLQTRWEGEKGHLQLAGLVRDLHFTSASISDKDSVAYALALTGAWHVGRRDHLVGGVTFGQGSDDYITGGLPRAVLNNHNRLDIQNGWSAFAGYQHLWTERLRSQWTLRHSELEGDAELGGFSWSNAVKSTDMVQANLIWSITSQFSAGMEYRYYRSNARGASDLDGHALYFSLMYQLF